MQEIALLKELKIKCQNMYTGDAVALDDVKRKGKMALNNLFPLKMYAFEVDTVRFDKGDYLGFPQSARMTMKDMDFKHGLKLLINIFDTAILDYENSKKNPKPITSIRPRVSEVVMPTPQPAVLEKFINVPDTESIKALTSLRKDFSAYKQSVRMWIIFVILLFISLIALYCFYMFSKWPWFAEHPKKLPIALLFELAFVFGILNIPLKKQWLTWVPVIPAVIITILSLI